MKPHGDRRHPRDPHDRAAQLRTRATDEAVRPCAGPRMPPRPLRDILGDDDDLPTLADSRRAGINGAGQRQQTSWPEKPPARSAGSPPGPRAAAPSAEKRPSSKVAPPQIRSPRVPVPDWREIEDRLNGPWFGRPLLRSQPLRLPMRGSLLLAMVGIVSLMILWSAGAGGGGSFLGNPAQWARFNNGGGTANAIAASIAGARPPGDYELKAPPSLTPAQIDRILTGYRSPATGTGQIWFELGQRYGIDPAFALAFFIHESGAGTSAAWAGLKPDGSTTHNVGNIICAGYARCYGRFRDYGSWEEGIEDWYRLIDVEYLQGRGHRTVADIIPVYAPSIENDVQNYINVVHRLVDEWRANGVR